MSAILLAVFTDYSDAERVRTQLVCDGFPTDRIELTASHDKGRAGLQPGKSAHLQFVQYFRTLLSQADERDFADALAQRVDAGGTSTVAVHPRGDIETLRAVELLEEAGAREVLAHDLQHNHSFEHAASRTDGYWVRHFMPQNPTGADCIYCRLFPTHAH
jgi:hypothetical protein